MERYKITPAAYCLLLDGEKVLLARRSHTGYMDGFYSVPAGHIEENELPEDCARRETFEEVGVNPLDLEFSSIIFNTVGTRGAYTDFFFAATKWDGEITNKEPDKCDDVNFFSLNGLPENLVPEVKSALENLKKKRYYSTV